MLAWVFGVECLVLIKCASEGTCFRLGVGCLLLGVDEVRIRGNMFFIWVFALD